MKLASCSWPIVVALTASAAADPAEPAGTVGVTIEEQTTRFGHLHVAAGLLGYQLSSTSSPVSTVSAVLELGRISFAGYATVPLLGVIGASIKPFRVEGQLRLTFKDAMEVERADVDLKTTVEQDKEHYRETTTFVKIPTLHRNRYTLDASVMYAHGAEKITNATKETTTASDALIGVVGYGVVDSSGYRLSIEGHGKRTDYRWTNGGLDLLVDLTRKYDLSPDAKGTRFGGRFWAEMLLGESSGLTARVEVGRYPAYSGWLLVASVGGSLHL